MRLVIVLLLFAFGSANAVQYDSCRFIIKDNPENVGEKTVDGFKIYLYKNNRRIRITDVGNQTEVECDALLRRKDQGEYEVSATAYNEVGESGGSPRVPFVVDPAIVTPSPPEISIAPADG